MISPHEVKMQKSDEANKDRDVRGKEKERKKKRRGKRREKCVSQSFSEETLNISS
jgi:hypothetical protein